MQISVSNVNKFFKSQDDENQNVHVLRDLSFQVQCAEFVAIFGPNACGKSTLLNVLSGLLECDSGNVKVADKPPSEANVGYVFQNYADTLLPWRTVLQNIAFPLELAGVRSQDRFKKVRNLLNSLSLSLPEHAYPYELSGGQKQLTVVARTLIKDPDILMMDEPFSALAFQTRLTMQETLLRIWERTKKTIVFVSHDIDEAIFLSDRIILMAAVPGNIVEQFNNPLGRPRDHETRNQQEYFDMRRHILNVFRKVIGA